MVWRNSDVARWCQYCAVFGKGPSPSLQRAFLPFLPRHACIQVCTRVRISLSLTLMQWKILLECGEEPTSKSGQHLFFVSCAATLFFFGPSNHRRLARGKKPQGIIAAKNNQALRLLVIGLWVTCLLIFSVLYWTTLSEIFKYVFLIFLALSLPFQVCLVPGMNPCDWMDGGPSIGVYLDRPIPLYRKFYHQVAIHAVSI